MVYLRKWGPSPALPKGRGSHAAWEGSQGGQGRGGLALWHLPPRRDINRFSGSKAYVTCHDD